MSDQSTSQPSWGEAVERLSSGLRALPLRADAQPKSRLWHCEIEVPSLDILRWLERQKASIKVYWQDRENQYEVAGLDAVDLVGDDDLSLPRILSERARSLLNHGDKDTAYFGGLRFDPRFSATRRSSLWKDFGDGLFVLPRIQLKRIGNAHILSCRLLPGQITPRGLEGIIEKIEKLRFDDESLKADGRATFKRHDNPDSEGWQNNVNAALKMIEEGYAQKIVLARETVLNFDRDLDPWQLLHNLRLDSEATYLFGLQPTEGSAFIGSSPERLYSRQGQDLQSEAVAGTRPRLADRDGDLRLADDLLSSDKDRREHELVAKSIVNNLGKLGQDAFADASADILKQSRVQHLVKKISAFLKDGVSDGDILYALHPTPAVGGSPGGAAIEAIRKLEAFDRGWYAGPIGWLSPRRAEFAVGIRSGLVRGRTLTLYSGAGIVPGSTPENEWQEIEHKMSSFLEAVGGERQ